MSDDLISRKQAIDALDRIGSFDTDADMEYARGIFNALPPAEQDIIRCKDCKYWNSGSCECREHAVNCQDYMVGDMETEAEHFCGYAERREENNESN